MSVINVDYITTTEELTSVADAIRAKTGDSGILIYPTGFITAINGISTSGTSRTISDITKTGTIVNIPAGEYSTTINYDIDGVQIFAPESGTKSFYITLPNGANDTITLTFTVDASGNSEITDDATDAYGVSY